MIDQINQTYPPEGATIEIEVWQRFEACRRNPDGTLETYYESQKVKEIATVEYVKRGTIDQVKVVFKNWLSAVGTGYFIEYWCESPAKFPVWRLLDSSSGE